MFVEKIQNNSALVIDLDIKYKDLYDERQYSNETINNILKFFFSKIEILFDLEPSNYQVWLFEKPNIRKIEKDGKYKCKDGIHLLFPNIKASKELYRHLIELIYEDKDIFEQILKDTCVNVPNNSVEEIVDKSIYSTNWLLYGSCKMEEVNKNIRYELTRIINLTDSGNIKDIPIDIYLKKPLKIIEKNSVYEDKQTVKYTEYTEDYLKGKKNINLKMNNTEIINNMDDNNDIDTDINEQLNIRLQGSEFDLIKLLVDNLSTDRSDNYEEWRNVGLMLNGHSKSRDMLNVWKEFSKKSTNYTKEQAEKSCDDKWKKWMTLQKKDNALTIRSLHWWVRQDIEIEKYRDLIKNSLSRRIEISLQGEKNTGAHYDVASVISEYYKNEFVCSGLKENFWYFFNEKAGGKWEPTEIGHELRKNLSCEIVEIYMYYGKKYHELSKNYEEGSINKNYYDRLYINCCTIQAKLKDSNYKDKIIRECRELFYDPEFNEKINSKLNLIGFDNGVFDLEKMEFRKGAPDDFVTVTTKYALPVNPNNNPIPFNLMYRKIMNDKKNKDILFELNDFIEKVLPNRKDCNGIRNDDRLREYVLRFLSSCLSGEVREEKFYFWTGSGGNGKSKLIELLDFTLGDYSKTLNVAYFTNKRDSAGAASPEVETLKYARFVSCSEPDEDDKIYVGKLKQITGGDKLTSRGLYKETTEFKPQFKIILMC